MMINVYWVDSKQKIEGGVPSLKQHTMSFTFSSYSVTSIGIASIHVQQVTCFGDGVCLLTINPRNEPWPSGQYLPWGNR